jgi:hypothetical protein
MNGGPAMTINLRRYGHQVVIEQIVTKRGQELGGVDEGWRGDLTLRSLSSRAIVGRGEERSHSLGATRGYDMDSQTEVITP